MDTSPAGRATSPSNPDANHEGMLIYFAQNPSLSDDLTVIEMTPV
jgi:hypothetical protein